MLITCELAWSASDAMATASSAYMDRWGAPQRDRGTAEAMASAAAG